MAPHPQADHFRRTVATYLVRLERFDIDGMAALFTDDAMIYSPIFGRMAPRSLFEIVRDSLVQSRVELRDILVSVAGAPRAIGYFRYHRTLPNGKEVVSDCCDVYEFDANGRIEKMTIVYDSHPICVELGGDFPPPGACG